jgi:hypothetical protein
VPRDWDEHYSAIENVDFDPTPLLVDGWKIVLYSEGPEPGPSRRAAS